MYGIKSRRDRWSISLCNCSQDTVHFHYGNAVLHIALEDLDELSLAMKTIAERISRSASLNRSWRNGSSLQ